MPPDKDVNHWAVRISLPYDRLSAVCEAYKDKMEGLLVYQHDEANRVHCHLLLYNCKITKQRLKQIGLLHLPGTELERNALWSWKQLGNTQLDVETYICYMSKGHIEPSYIQGFEWKDVERYRMKWVTPTARVTITKGHQGYLDFEKHVLEKDISLRVTVEDIRRYATRWAFTKHGWFSQVANNESKNYAATYIFKYHL